MKGAIIINILNFLLVLALFVFVVYIVYHCWVVPKQIKNKKIEQEALKYREKIEAEGAKMRARIAGDIVRKNIDEIAKRK